MKRYRTTILEWGIPVLLIVFMMAWLSGAFHRGKIRPGKVEVAGARSAGVPLFDVSAVAVPQVAEAVGIVKPQVTTTVSARLTAHVVELPVVAGQRVRKGALLARLDDRDLSAKVQQAQEALRRAEAIRDLAAADYERDKGLFEKAVIPASEFDSTATRLKTSTADVAALQEALHDARLMLGYATILSPYECVIIDKLAEVGDLATPGKPLLTAYKVGSLWLEAAVPEELSGHLHIGASYQVRLDAVDKHMQGPLAEIVPSADPSTRTVTARVAIPAEEHIFPGLFGRMEIPLGDRQRVLVPRSAVVLVGQLAMVDVDEGGMLRRRSVQLGAHIGDSVEILSGVAAGEKVSLAPRKELEP
jgi:RND family efflux transporter MFP subunit